MRYIFEKTEVPLARWCWGVVYKDGTELKQFDDNGKFHQIGEVIQENVRYFILYKPDFSRRIDLLVPEGARLIHKYRNFVFNIGTKYEKKETIFVFGYKLKNHYHFNYIMPDDVVIQSTEENLPLSNFIA